MTRGRPAARIKNRTIFTGDNLKVMRGMESETIDLIYLDPPFKSDHNYASPMDSEAAGAEFKDTWTLKDVDLSWWGEISEKNESLYTIIDAARKISGRSAMSYLIYMSIRILEMHRILKSTGSLYLHCDTTMSHYLKLILDSIFGAKFFRNDVTWKRTSSHSDGRRYGKIADHVLFYTKSKKYTWNSVKIKFDETYVEENYNSQDDRGYYKHSDLTAESLKGGGYAYEYKGHNRIWKRTKESMLDLERQGLIHMPKKRGGLPRYKTYLVDAKGVAPQNIWTDIPNVQGDEKVGYPTQKPLALLERIIENSSRENDVVFDPFCGCATACLAAERVKREWIGCDISEKAYLMIKSRLQNDAGLDKFTRGAGQVIHRTDIPQRDGSASHDIRYTLYGSQKGICNGCRYHYMFKDMELDHIVPASAGGSNRDDNLQLLCGNCNRRKGSRLDMDGLRVLFKKEGLLLGNARKKKSK